MLFNSYSFILFFAIVLLVHYSPLAWQGKKVFLLLASYLFYAAWNPPFVILLWISTLADWHLARQIHRTPNKSYRKQLLAVSLIVNLGMLGFFKYGGFLLDNFILLCGSLGISYQPVEWSIVLPVGISFYTFQTLSYTIDVYRGKLKPCGSPIDFALFVTFFPQLVAGPIVRAVDFLPQCNTEKRANESEFGFGLALLLTGLFQKVVLADGLFAPIVETVYDPLFAPSTLSAWAGTVAFAGQIYCDFAGYSNCAIGVAMCLGFRLTENFRYPYASIGFSDFWRRWHLSLSSWLRDYLYIPLGGNRYGNLLTLRNLLITMFLGGLWHGAAWTYVAWGILHGTFLIIERLLVQSKLAAMKLWNTYLGQVTLWIITFISVCLSWVFFRAESFPQASQMIASMAGFGLESSSQLAPEKMLVGIAGGLLLVAQHRLMKDFDSNSLQRRVNESPVTLRAFALALMAVSIILMPGTDRAFIYFQF